MAEKIEVKKTIKFEPTMSAMVIEAGDLEKALNRALRPMINGYQGCRLHIRKQVAPGGIVVQYPSFIISIDKFSESVDREQSPKLGFMLGAKSAFGIKQKVKDIVKNFVFEEEELDIFEKPKAICIKLNFFRCLQQIFENNSDYRIKYERVDYYTTRFDKQTYRYVWLTQMEGSLREEFEKNMRKQNDDNKNGFFYNSDYEEEDDDNDYNSAT